MKFKTLIILIIFGVALDVAITLWLYAFDLSSFPVAVLSALSIGIPTMFALILSIWFVIKLSVLLDKLNTGG